jgi:steroid delta-isomerase-like uncharacterized protein
MTRAELEAFLTRHMASMARHDPAALAADHAIDATVQSPMFATLHGRAAIEESYRALFVSFPDWLMTPLETVIDPPHIALFVTVSATHVNEFFGLPGTHRHAEFQSVRCMTLEDGLIARERRIYDFTGFLVQMGVLRAKPARP